MLVECTLVGSNHFTPPLLSENGFIVVGGGVSYMVLLVAIALRKLELQQVGIGSLPVNEYHKIFHAVA